MSETAIKNLSEEEKAKMLESLKARADSLGIKYTKNIKLETLNKKIQAYEAEQEDEENSTESSTDNSPSTVLSKEELEEAHRKEWSRLIRIRVTCMNPNKKEWEGETFRVSNAVAGTFHKYVPFDAPDGWHVPKIVVEYIKSRKCQIFVPKKLKNGATISKAKLINEFAVEELPPLSKKEIEKLARKQALQNNEDLDEE